MAGIIKTLKKAKKIAKQAELDKDQTAQQGSATAGEASKTRQKLGEIGKKSSGLIKEYKRTLKQLDTNKNLSDEQITLMMEKLSRMRKNLTDAGLGDEIANLNKGGMPKKKKVPAVSISVGMVEIPKGKGKAKMMRGGMANKKEHMYAAGGSVTDNAGLRALKASGPKGMQAYKKITGK